MQGLPTTRSGVVLDGPLPPMPPPYVNPDNAKAKETEVTKDKVQPESSQSTANVQPREFLEMAWSRGKDGPFRQILFVVDFECDLSSTSYLGRPFLRTARTLIDVFSREMSLYVRMRRDWIISEEEPKNAISLSEVVKCDSLTTNGDPITPSLATIPTKEKFNQ
ncbi:hypothetical protein Tco_1018496 [Tanacetum coccineum]|uniref:Uncharacterized protein n=1 Tax=Tanacetum coccineum TaxID=301880 RepID=A0ABQ5FUI0_9ASTR